MARDDEKNVSKNDTAFLLSLLEETCFQFVTLK